MLSLILWVILFLIVFIIIALILQVKNDRKIIKYQKYTHKYQGHPDKKFKVFK